MSGTVKWCSVKFSRMESLFHNAESFDHVSKVTVFGYPLGPPSFDGSAFINDECKKQLTYASFSQQTAAFDLIYSSWSSAVCPS